MARSIRKRGLLSKVHAFLFLEGTQDIVVEVLAVKLRISNVSPPAGLSTESSLRDLDGRGIARFNGLHLSHGPG